MHCDSTDRAERSTVNARFEKITPFSLCRVCSSTSYNGGAFKKKNSNSEHRLCRPSQIPSQNSVAPQALQCWPQDLYLRVNLLVSM
ncbi:hypothetical protein Q9233_006668 [Columba guinea]|nr:hypothetical protein Q9233_006668 [Columba guinea]